MTNIPSRRHFITTLLATALLTACGQKEKLVVIPAGEVVLAFGDSVTYGTGAGPEEDWPSWLAGLTGWRIVNAGVPGDTAEAGKARLPGLLDAHRPKLVIIEIGGNDFLRRRTPAAVKEDLRAIIRSVKGQGIPAVLVAVPELSLLAAIARRPSDSPIYQELAKEEGIPLIPDVFSDILGQPALCADAIHPNAQGYQQMATGIHAALRQIGLVA
jgi:acyl-CoA thioesterase I